jgi:zinc transporter ZupT
MLAQNSLVLFVSVLAGGGLFFLLKKTPQHFLKLTLSFSGAFLFSITVLHLMPEVYQQADFKIGIWIMIGFFLQIVLEFFSEGIEHGHVHVHDHQHHFPLAMMLSLCLHSFLEAMPLSSENDGNNNLLIGIAMHHIPVAFAFVSMLVQSGVKRNNAFLFLALFGLMGPLGASTSFLLGAGMVPVLTALAPKIMAIVIGIFLHISTTILFESSSNHRFNLMKMIVIVIGGLAGILLS